MEYPATFQFATSSRSSISYILHERQLQILLNQWSPGQPVLGGGFTDIYCNMVYVNCDTHLQLKFSGCLPKMTWYMVTIPSQLMRIQNTSLFKMPWCSSTSMYFTFVCLHPPNPHNMTMNLTVPYSSPFQHTRLKPRTHSDPKEVNSRFRATPAWLYPSIKSDFKRGVISLWPTESKV